MVAVATGISISFAPAHISFSVAYAGTTKVAVDASGHQFKWYYNLTLVAHDSSRRREVKYGSIAADIWWSETKSMPTDEAAGLPSAWQPPGSSPRVNLGVERGQYDEKENGTLPAATPPPPPLLPAAEKGNVSSRVEWPICRVVVEAKVWFRLARMIPTLPYTITATCFPVNFYAGPEIE
ncbi:hypothetical protein HU200_056461 [Digitaria exilis]|uniref:Uncharacterized protein n=1 Tax=Digitaria exilis TaxID=1010633 RepID=A0A835E5W9_9POAL|nr:hypothetical protein HU200_056461 [Digitaria exilis]